ncbi:unnamed protein product [Mycena citricolor]|uniref:ribonuclease H n=1 Tax=Mycena citricolor TaxID=2018698 RepID=A0AAD2HLY3_9AGAR|nr:unnamed protein product [Mycena citricolor]
MPKVIEERLEKRVRKFIWAEKDKVTINRETVYAPAEMGGRDLLDIVARNEAIAIMWLKTYLSIGDERPLWCFVADEILANKMASDGSNVELSVRLNSYLQDWKHKVSAKEIGKDLAKMTSVGKKHGVAADAIAVSREIQGQMIIWHHTKSNAEHGMWKYKKDTIKCLKEKHKMKTVKDAVQLERKMRTNRHVASKRCRCNACTEVRESTGCTSPHVCYRKAGEMLDTLDPKWDPRKTQPEDYEHRMTPEVINVNGVETRDIDQRITTTGLVGDIFRVFTDNERNMDAAAPNLEPATSIEEETTELMTYTDGSATNNGREGAEAGAGIYFNDNDNMNRAIKIPNEFGPSNQVAEMLAVKETIDLCPPGLLLHIKTDSMYTIKGLTQSIRKWEDQGFFLTANGDLAKLTITKIRGRCARTRLTWVKGHAGTHGNEQADRLADEGRRKNAPDIIDTRINESLVLPGAKLKAMTQSLAYKIIRISKMREDRYQDALDQKATTRNIELAKEATVLLEPEPRGAATTAQIWLSTRHQDFSRSVRYFLWMLIHDGYKVGDHWRKIPGHEEKAYCKHCGEVIENMEHILLRCEAAGQSQIWDLANVIWKKKTGLHLELNIGKIMACGAVTLGNASLSRLFRIVVSESAHMIWRLRCERVIQEKDEASRREIQNRWLRAINTRLLIDCVMTNTARYGPKAIKPSLVRKTWTKTIQNEEHLPDDWTKGGGVLVGVG